VSPATSSTVYKGKSGQWAFVLHRITGFLVFMFLLLHVVDVSLVNASPTLYNEVHDLYGNVLLRLFEVGLLGALVFHAFNGLRIVMIDFFPGAIRSEKVMFTIVIFFSVVLTAVGGFVILKRYLVGTAGLL
jgi:succinate dehydrogenase / fumarate reductase cytochrome b subunit